MTASIPTTRYDTSRPYRVQLRRTKGWRLPPNTTVVSRPTRWGNPFGYRKDTGLARVPALDGAPWEYEDRISADGMRHDYWHPDGRVTVHHIRYMTRAECVEVYQRALVTPTPDLHLWHRGQVTVDDVRRELTGRNLACWCPLVDAEGNRVPCHADVLLAVANAPGGSR